MANKNPVPIHKESEEGEMFEIPSTFTAQTVEYIADSELNPTRARINIVIDVQSNAPINEKQVSKIVRDLVMGRQETSEKKDEFVLLGVIKEKFSFLRS